MFGLDSRIQLNSINQYKQYFKTTPVKIIFKISNAAQWKTMLYIVVHPLGKCGPTCRPMEEIIFHRLDSISINDVGFGTAGIKFIILMTVK